MNNNILIILIDNNYDELKNKTNIGNEFAQNRGGDFEIIINNIELVYNYCFSEEDDEWCVCDDFLNSYFYEGNFYSFGNGHSFNNIEELIIGFKEKYEEEISNEINEKISHITKEFNQFKYAIKHKIKNISLTVANKPIVTIEAFDGEIEENVFDDESNFESFIIKEGYRYLNG